MPSKEKIRVKSRTYAKSKIVALSLAVTATLSGCSEPSMFEKCVAKEAQDISNLPENKQVLLQEKYGNPFYNAELAILTGKQHDDVSVAVAAYIKAHLDEYKNNSTYRALEDERYRLLNHEDYRPLAKARLERNADLISIDEFKEIKDQCLATDACSTIKEQLDEVQVNIDALNISFPDLPIDHYEKLRNVTKEMLSRMSEEDINQIQSMIEDRNESKKVSEKRASDVKTLVEAIFRFPTETTIPESYEKAWNDRLEVIETFAGKGLKERLSPFIESVSDEHIAGEICNERGLYE